MKKMMSRYIAALYIALVATTVACTLKPALRTQPARPSELFACYSCYQAANQEHWGAQPSLPPNKNATPDDDQFVTRSFFGERRGTQWAAGIVETATYVWERDENGAIPGIAHSHIDRNYCGWGDTSALRAELSGIPEDVEECTPKIRQQATATLESKF